MSKTTISTSPDLCEIITSLPTMEAAEALANILLDQHLAACCHILSPITAIYSWNGERHSHPEYPLIAKTRLSLATETMSAIAEAHPYDVPEVLCRSVTLCSEVYTVWTAEVTTGIPPSTPP
jgi:periplasmic divalent cation tolerance protein